MKKLCMCATVIALSLLTVSCASMFSTAPELSSDKVRITNTSQGRFVELPKGVRIDAVLGTTLSSTGSKVGDRLYVTTIEPVSLDGRTLIPAGTRINGTVSRITGPKMKVSKYKLLKAKIVVAFDSIELGGRRYPFVSKTDIDKSALAVKGAKAGGEWAAKETAKRMVPGLGYVFLAMDAKKGYDYVTSDKEIVLEKGTLFVIKLKEPTSVPLR